MRLIPVLTALLLLPSGSMASAKPSDAVCYIELTSGTFIDLSSLCGGSRGVPVYLPPGTASSVNPVANDQAETDKAYLAAMVKKLRGNGTIGAYPAAIVQSNVVPIVESARLYCVYRRQGIDANAGTRRYLELNLFIPDKNARRSTVNLIVNAQATLAPQYYCPEMKSK